MFNYLSKRGTGGTKRLGLRKGASLRNKTIYTQVKITTNIAPKSNTLQHTKSIEIFN